MFELADCGPEALVCTIINLSERELGVIKGAKLVAGKEVTGQGFFTQPDTACDMLITVVDRLIDDPEYQDWSGLVAYSGLKLLVCSSEVEAVLSSQVRNSYDGVIQCEPVLMSALLKDLIEPIAIKSMVGADPQDLGRFFTINQGQAQYQRLTVMENDWPDLIIPAVFDLPYTSLGLLQVLTTNQHTELGLFEYVRNRAEEVTPVVYQVLFHRQDETAEEAVGLLWFEDMLLSEATPQ